MISARDEVIGVIQLINKRAKGWIAARPAGRLRGRRRAVRRRLRGVRRRRSRRRPASRSRTSLLYEEVKTLFDGFVQGRGHRDRVARSDDVAATPSASPSSRSGSREAVDRAESGHYREVRFSRDDLTQIEYAALLHDFGKVGVREHVLVKAKKLYEHERELILQRFQLIKRGYKIEGLETQGPLPDGGVARRRSRARARRRSTATSSRKVAELDDIIQFILAGERADRARAGRLRADRRDRRHDATATSDGATLPFLIARRGDAACRSGAAR